MLRKADEERQVAAAEDARAAPLIAALREAGTCPYRVLKCAGELPVHAPMIGLVVALMTDTTPEDDDSDSEDEGDPLFDVGASALQERCNGEDDDCDGVVDEGFDLDWVYFCFPAHYAAIFINRNQLNDCQVMFKRWFGVNTTVL